MTPFEKIAKKAGAGRISKEALEEIRDIMTERAESISEQAVRISRHAGRKTVMKEDIEFVIGKKK
jgi:histone H3/H4